MLVVWRDALALLQALAEPVDEHLREGMLFLGRGRSDQLGVELEPDVVHDALLALEDAGYVEWTDWNRMSGTIGGLRVTGRGMQALGQWPALYTVMRPASLAHLLEDLAPYAADAEKKGILEDAAANARTWAVGALRESVTSLGSAVVRARFGIGP